MANYPVATVNITLQTASANRAGFGTPIFISSHRSFNERVRTYNTLTGVADDFGAGTPTYQAASMFFANSPSTSSILIGRRDAVGTYTPAAVETGNTYTITVSNADGDSITATYTALVADTEEDVVDALVAVITGDVDVAANVTATKVGTGSTATMTLTKVAAEDTFTVSDLENITETYTSTELAGDVLAAVQEVTDNFYFVTAEDHTETFVMDMAAAVEATEKVYFVSSQEVSSLTPYSVASTDILAKLFSNSYERTATFWDEEADTGFIECRYVGAGAPYSPDEQAIVWQGMVLSGQNVARNPSGYELTPTQQGYLKARNASFLATTNSGVVTIGAKMANGVWIDDRRTADCVTARVRESLETLLLNVAGTKVPGGRRGIAACEGAIKKALNPFIPSNALSSYTIYTSNATIDPNTRTVSGISFEGILQGAIVEANINGSLVNEEIN